MKEAGVMPELPKNLRNIVIKKERYIKLNKNIKIVQNYILQKV